MVIAGMGYSVDGTLLPYLNILPLVKYIYFDGFRFSRKCQLIGDQNKPMKNHEQCPEYIQETSYTSSNRLIFQSCI